MDNQELLKFIGSDRLTVAEAMRKIDGNTCGILFLTDDVDEFLMNMLGTYAEKSFCSVNADDLGLESEEEKKMLEEMGLALEFGGYMNFKSEDQQKAYFQRVEEIGETEADLEIDPVALPKLDGIQISAEELEALEGFVEFTEE